MKEAVFTIRRKDSDKFEVQSKGSTGWFNPDPEFSKIKFLHLNQNSIKNLYEKDIEGQYMEPYKTFFVPFDYTKLDIININDPVKNISSSSDKETKPKEEVVAQICGEITLPKESIKTQKVINIPNLINQSESPAPESIVVDKLQPDISVNY